MPSSALSPGRWNSTEKLRPLGNSSLFVIPSRARDLKLETSSNGGELPFGAHEENTLDFQLNEEQLHLKKTVREFAEREIAPNVMKWDEASEFPMATIKEWGKLGLLGIIFPPEYGGAGMGYVEYVTAVAELSRVDGSVGIIVAADPSLCSNHIFLAANEAQKKKYIPKLATA